MNEISQMNTNEPCLGLNLISDFNGIQSYVYLQRFKHLPKRPCNYLVFITGTEFHRSQDTGRLFI